MMTFPTVDLCDPADAQAVQWCREYLEHQKVARHLPGWVARFYAMRYEPSTWVAAWLTLCAFCSLTYTVGMWTGVLSIVYGVGVTSYWMGVWRRGPAALRRYQRLLRERRVLRVPKFLYDAVNREAHERYLDDWDEFEARRFVLLRETLNDAEPWLHQLQDDCGCKERCGHTNRLAGATRRQLRRRIRVAALRKVELMDAEHGAAIEMTIERNLQIRNQLRLTAEEDD